MIRGSQSIFQLELTRTLQEPYKQSKSICESGGTQVPEDL